jgi:hypothetical protein
MLAGCAVTGSYSTSELNSASMTLPPPVSFVLPGTSGFSGSVPFTVMVAPLGVAAPPPGSPPPPPHAVVTRAMDSNPAVQAAARRARMSPQSAERRTRVARPPQFRVMLGTDSIRLNRVR